MSKKRIVKSITSKYKEQKLEDVFHEFYRLYFRIKNKNNNDIDMQNYLIIRLVTIIEQFFRKVVEIQFKKNQVKSPPKEITIDISILDDMREVTKELIISSSYNFQSVDAIKEGMRDVKIKILSKDHEKYLQSLDELFKLRHDTVHTVISSNTSNIDKYYNITEGLMNDIFKKMNDVKHQFEVYRNNALKQLGIYKIT